VALSGDELCRFYDFKYKRENLKPNSFAMFCFGLLMKPNHKRNGYASHPQIPKYPRADKECPGEELSYLPEFDCEIESRYGVENDEDVEPDG